MNNEGQENGQEKQCDLQMICAISNRGTCGECNRDKKHCCFYWELNYELNLSFKTKIIHLWNY